MKTAKQWYEILMSDDEPTLTEAWDMLEDLKIAEDNEEIFLDYLKQVIREVNFVSYPVEIHWESGTPFPIELVSQSLDILLK